MTSLEPLPLPELDGDWSAWLADRCASALDRAAELRAELVAGPADPLDVWNRLGIELANGPHAAHLMAQVHPDAGLREQAEGHVVEAEKFRTDLMLDAAVFAALAGVDAAGLDDGAGPGAGEDPARLPACRRRPRRRDP